MNKRIFSVMFGVLLGTAACLFSFCRPALAAGENLSLSAQSAVLIDGSNGRVIAEKNPDEKLPMASTTKILTALLTLEAAHLDEAFTVDAAAIQVEGTSMGLRAGDQVTLRTLAAGMLLASGNDAANAAAVRLGGSLDEFAMMMNRRAAQIGVTSSNFVTPSGLDAQSHYSTARDMAQLARAALQNPDFRALCSQTSLKLSYGNPPYDRWLSNHNRLLKTYPGCIGVKTGFTKKSGRCLVSAAQRDGVLLICVTLRAPNDWEDHRKLLDYGFSQLEAVTLPGEISRTVPVVGGTADQVLLVQKEPVTVPLLVGDRERIVPKTFAPPFVYAPVSAGDDLGEVRYYLDDVLLETATLVAEETVLENKENEKRSLWRKIEDWFAAKWHGT